MPWVHCVDLEMGCPGCITCHLTRTIFEGIIEFLNLSEEKREQSQPIKCLAGTPRKP
jgi:hypothetical protein